MPEADRHHVKLFYVLPASERDLWNEQDSQIKDSWRNALLGEEQLAAVGQESEYFCDLTPEKAREFASAKNCASVVPVERVEAQNIGSVSEAEVVAPEGANILMESDRIRAGEDLNEEPHEALDFAFPEAQTMAYHRATGSEANPNVGAGFLVSHLDTGVSRAQERLTGGKVLFRRSYVGEDSYDGVSSHGSATASLAFAGKADVMVHEVLGHDGSGGSDGITAAIYETIEFVKKNPQYRNKCVLTGSLGSPPGPPFGPYVDACRKAEAAGILCIWSAGNDGRHGIGRPANWRDRRASIAFNRATDRRATFSNYRRDAAISTEGESVLVLDREGKLRRMSGTSFSLPLLTRHTIVLADLHDVSVFAAFDALLASARDTVEPIEEEASGMLDFRSASKKLRKTKPVKECG